MLLAYLKNKKMKEENVEQKIERRKHTHKQGGINISDLSIYSWYEKNYINT